MKTLIFRLLYFLKMYPIFVGSVHNFGRSDDAIIYIVKNAYLHSNTKMHLWFDAHLDQKSVTVSSVNDPSFINI